MGVCGGRDEQVHHAPSGLASLADGLGGEPAVAVGDGLVHRQWVEALLQPSQAGQSHRPGIVGLGERTP